MLTANLPVAVADIYNVNEDTVLNASSVLSNDTDADGDLINRAILSSGTSHGTLSLNSDGTFIYTPNANYNGPDSFSYFANDSAHNETSTLAAVVTINITPINDAPVGTPGSLTTSEDLAGGGTLTGTDADGNSLTFLAGSAAPAHGSVVINSNGTYTYTPTANFHGADSFSFKANDGTANSADAFVSVTVTSVNDAPVATAASVILAEDGAYSGTLTGSDVDGDPITFSAGTLGAAHGALVINSNGSFTYTPAADYNGSDSFRFKTNDGTANSVEATLSLTITAVNDAPAGTPATITLLEDNVFSGNLSATDVDGDSLTFLAGTVPATHGTVVISSNGAFTYTPTANYNGNDTFSFKANDGTVSSANATVSVSITAVNDAPVATASSVTLAEDGAYSGTLVATDGDGNPLTFSAGTVVATHGTVIINPNGSFTYTPVLNYNGSDAFSFKANDGTANSVEATLSLTITAVNDAPVGTATSITLLEGGVFSGTLTGGDIEGDPLTFLAGTVAAAHGTAVINANGSFTYTPVANYNGSDTFSFKASDGSATSVNSTVSVTATAVNDAPVATAANVSLNEDGVYSGTLGAVDVDGNPLAFSAGTVTAAHGIAVISSNGSFTYTPFANYNGSDAFSFKANDGTVNSAEATVSLTVTAVNDAPVGTAASITLLEDGVFSGTLAGTDIDGDPLAFLAGTVVATHGTAVISANGSFTYTPVGNYNGTDTFSFKVSDGTATSTAATASVTVTPVNDAPVANALSVSVNEDTTLGGTLTGTDVDGDPLTFLAGTIPAAHGTVVINSNGSFIYTPNANFNGTDTFGFKTNDGTTNSANGTVNVLVLPIGDPPVASASTITINEDSAFSGTLSGTDPDNDPLTFSAGALTAAHGTVVINASGTFTYTPAANYSGADTFSFRVNDGTSNSGEATVLVVVTAVNDAPVANSTAVTTNEDTALNGALTGSDVDGNLLTFAAGAVTPSNGTLSINSNGTFTYTPKLNFNGADVFSFLVNDGTINSSPVLVTVNVVAVNDAPVAATTNITIAEDTALTGDLNATDAEGSPLTFAAGLLSAAHGTVIINPNGTFSYTPTANFHGSDAFSFTANDGTFTSSAATVTVNVTSVNDAPLVSPLSLTTNEDTAVGGTLVGSDVDGNALVFSTGTVTAAHGTVTINSNGTFSYLPATSFNGSDSFTYKANDGTVNSADATVTISVTAVNDAPVGASISRTIAEDTVISGALTGSDAEGDPLTFSAGAVTASHGTVVINPNGAFNYTPTPNFNGTDVFSFTINDGTVSSADATVTITVTPVEDPPVATGGTGNGNGNGNITTNEDTIYTGALTGTDPDGDPLTFLAGAVTASHGAVIINSNGAITYTPNPNFNGTDSFSFKVNDGKASSADALVNVTVIAVNDAPVVNFLALTTNEDTTLTGTLTGTDADSDPLTFSAGTVPAAHGTVVINSNGSFAYTPNANFNGSDAFSFKANDGTTNSTGSTVAVFVTSVNDAPVATALSITTNEDAALSGTLTGTDADGDPVTFSLGTIAAVHGTINIGSNGTFNYLPNANFNGADSFSYRVTDGILNSAEATVSITVTAVNDPPVPTAANISMNEDTTFSGTLTGTDVDGDPLVFSAGTVTPAHGTAVINPNGTFTYVPNANYNGNDSFAIKVNDSTSNSAEATVTISVTAVNDLPVAVDGSGTLEKNTTLTGSLAALASDVEGDARTFSLVTQPAHGTLSLSPDGTFIYTPIGGFDGTDSCTFQASDGRGVSNTATYTLNVTKLFDLVLATTPGRIATTAKSLVPVDPTAKIINVSPSVKFSNATVSASIITGQDRRDRIQIRKGVRNSGDISVRGKRVFYHGFEVAQFAGGRAGLGLQVNFNSSATLDAVHAVVQRIGVRTARTASRAIRTLQIQVRTSGDSSAKTISCTQ